MPGPLVRWDPFHPFSELSEMRTRFDRMFDQLTGGVSPWMPAIDVQRDDGNLIVRADLPGINPDEVKIEVEDDILTISGQHQEESKEEKKNDRYLRRERAYGSFSRSIALPAGVDTKKIKANTHDGVLEVTIPLPKEASKEKVQITPTST